VKTGRSPPIDAYDRRRNEGDDADEGEPKKSFHGEADDNEDELEGKEEDENNRVLYGAPSACWRHPRTVAPQISGLLTFRYQPRRGPRQYRTALIFSVSSLSVP